MSDMLPVRARFVQRAPDGNLTEDDLKRINALTSKPFSANDLFGFACVMATGELTDYCTRMGVSSLRNFANDAASGVPYVIDHVDNNIYGYTFDGEQGANGEAMAAVYVPRNRWPAGKDGRGSNQEIADLQAGLRREVSIFWGGPNYQATCDICGQDAFSWDCPHLLGKRYDGRQCTATIEGARLVNVAGVHRGACPGAVIGKAEQMYSASKMSTPEYREWLDTMHVPNSKLTISLPTQANHTTRGADASQKGKHMKERIIAALSALGLTSLSAALATAPAETESWLPILEGQLPNALSAHVESQVKARIDADPRVKFAAECEAKIREDAGKEAVRLFGAEQGKTTADTLAALPIAQVQAMSAIWKATADAKLGVTDTTGAQRQTAPANRGTEAVDANQGANANDDWEARKQKMLNASHLGRAALAERGRN